MSAKFKPILAETAEKFEDVQLPVLASYKIDGVRIVCTADGPRTRKLVPPANEALQRFLNRPELAGLDGEVVFGPPNAHDTLQVTSAAVRTIKGPDPDEVYFTYFVFDDCTDPALPFKERHMAAYRRVLEINDPRIVALEHYSVASHEALQDLEEEAVNAGYEGLMTRSFDGRYKFGRSTLKEQILLKIKRFLDTEATIVGFVEMMHNDNEALKDELGRTKRSKDAEGLRPAGTLGALVCKADQWDETFEIGTGFTAEMKKDIWNRRDELLGKQVTFKYMPHGTIDRPRHPVFKVVREAD